MTNFAIFIANLKPSKVQFLQQALAIHKVVHWFRDGSKDRDELNTKHNLLDCTLKLALYQHTEDKIDGWHTFIQNTVQKFQKIVNLRVSLLGEDHKETIRSKCKLAETMNLLDDPKERQAALQIMMEVGSSRATLLGDNHLETVETRGVISDMQLEHEEEAQLIRDFVLI